MFVFKNVGKKIKLLSWILLFVSIGIYSLAAFVFLISSAISLFEGYFKEAITTFFMAIALPAVGVALSWIALWFVYGFGEIIDSVVSINKKTPQNSPEGSAKNEMKDPTINESVLKNETDDFNNKLADDKLEKDNEKPSGELSDIKEKQEEPVVVKASPSGEIICPHCENKGNTNMFGVKVRCLKCGNVIYIASKEESKDEE